MKGTCKFCRILTGELRGWVVLEDEVSSAFLDDRPHFPGHVLLVPRIQYETLTDLPPALVEPLFLKARLLARAVEAGLKAEGTFVAINNRISQSVRTCTSTPAARGFNERSRKRCGVWARPYISPWGCPTKFRVVIGVDNSWTSTAPRTAGTAR